MNRTRTFVWAPHLETDYTGSGSSTGAKYEKLSHYQERLDTFKTYNFPVQISQTPHQFARAGMFYSGYGDAILCYWCGNGFIKWLPEDDPFEEHAKHFPDCHLLHLIKGPEYINRFKGQKGKRQKNKPETETEELATPMPVVGKECVICTSAERQIAFDPCGHFITCVECSLNIQTCCMCRMEINKRVRIYNP